MNSFFDRLTLAKIVLNVPGFSSLWRGTTTGNFLSDNDAHLGIRVT